MLRSSSDPANGVTTRALIRVRRSTYAVCVLLAACARPGRDLDLPMPPQSTGTAAMHAVHNEELRDVMMALASTSFDRLPQELDGPGRERTALQAASSRAQELADAADRIAIIADQTGLEPEQQQAFVTLAERLRDGALLLRTQADSGRTRLMTTTMKEIDDTCTSCHQLFRAPEPATAGTR
jgi:cytochrome c556